ncbi:hypothetical protein HBB16_00255 [Pseudonocardia sp. MCCB 268]|nr:hypothetical protein [Pseudonocardia cytotoxica]
MTSSRRCCSPSPSGYRSPSRGGHSAASFTPRSTTACCSTCGHEGDLRRPSGPARAGGPGVTWERARPGHQEHVWPTGGG